MDPYSEYGSGSRKLLNTDPIRIRIHNIDWSVLGGTQQTFTVSIHATGFPASATALSMLQPKREDHHHQLLTSHTIEEEVGDMGLSKEEGKLR